MLRIVVIAALLALGNASFRINTGKCVTRNGEWGQTVQCPSGYAATGMCGSTDKPNCHGSWVKIVCCAINAFNGNNCNQYDIVKDGGAGYYLRCSGNGVVTALCGSGYNPDCGGRNKFNRIHCSTTGLQVTGNCHWRSGKAGQTVYCSRNEVVDGVCSSGRHYNCNHHSHAIRCCYVQ